MIYAIRPGLETYHPMEERVLIKREHSGGQAVKNTSYISDEFIRVKNTSGTYDYTYVKHEGQRVAERKHDGTKIYMHPDHLGSTTLITDSSGNGIENTSYTPYGVILEGGDTSRYSYEGQEYDNTINQYDFHFRGYKAEWGIFAQPDSLIPNVYDPQSLNRYSFERGNPYRYTDIDGNTWIDMVNKIRNIRERYNDWIAEVKSTWEKVPDEHTGKGDLEAAYEITGAKYGVELVCYTSKELTHQQLKAMGFDGYMNSAEMVDLRGNFLESTTSFTISQLLSSGGLLYSYIDYSVSKSTGKGIVTWSSYSISSGLFTTFVTPTNSDKADISRSKSHYRGKTQTVFTGKVENEAEAREVSEHTGWFENFWNQEDK